MTDFVMKRTRAIAALIVVVLSMSAVPSTFFGGDAVPSASAAAATEYNVDIGWMSEIVNWNPMYLAMVEDWVACFLMYSALFQYDEKYEFPKPDLVLTYNMTYHANGEMTIWLNLTRNAYWRNNANPGDTSERLDAYDVSYTFWVACSRTDTAWEYYLRDYDCKVVDQYTVRLDVPFYKAAALDDITGIPIISNGFYNETFGGKINGAMEPEECIGTGPFVFADMLEASWYKFGRAENYHGTLDYGEERLVKITNITYTLYSSSNSLATDMDNGDLDVGIFTGQPTVFLSELTPTDDNMLIKEAVPEVGICDIALNAVPPVLRNGPTDDGKDYCDGNLHLQDPLVRKAILMTLNKTWIREGIMKNLTVIADSVLMPCYWQADIEGVLPYDIEGAKDALEEAGYVMGANNYYVAGPTSMFMQNDYDAIDDPELSGIRLHCPDTDPCWFQITEFWASCADDAGIGLDSEQLSETYMINEEWYNCMYDIWVWHWGWGPEPLSDLSVWQSYEIVTGGDNCQMPMGEWWVHKDNYTISPFVDAAMIEEFEMDSDSFIAFSSFDQNFSLAAKTINAQERRDIVFDLQQMIYDSYCETPPYYDVGLYAISELRYQCWGDWENNMGLTATMSPPWIWFLVIPADNRVPVIENGLVSEYELEIDEVKQFSITVNDTDDAALWVNWTFGDGTVDQRSYPVDDSTVISVSHSYSEQGTYPLTVEVTDGHLYHEQTSSATVTVMAEADAYPVLSAFWPSPSSAYVGEETSWDITCQDVEATDLRITFDWGDGTYSVFDEQPDPVGSAVTLTDVKHTWTAPGEYDVTVSGWDFVPLLSHNVSLTKTGYEVSENVAPTVPVVSSVETNEDLWTAMSATTSDVDPDTLTVTWDWGGGAFNVTNHDTSADPGATVLSRVYHMWDTPGDYEVTVWVDDGEGHNVSCDPVTVTVNPAGTELPPTGITLVYSPSPGYVDEEVTFTIEAQDLNEDPLDFYVEFGDGEGATESTAGGAGIQGIELTHTYDTVDDYTVTVHVDDGSVDGNVSQDYTVSIVERPANSPPEIILGTSYSAMYNETFTIVPGMVSDDDGDDLTVWYDWGDGTPGAAGDPDAGFEATHVYSVTGAQTLTAYVYDNTDDPTHNVSVETTVDVNYNRRPETKSVTVSPASGPYYVGDVVTFTVVVADDEGDNLSIRIDFGDDSAIQTATRNDVAADENITEEFTHSFGSPGTVIITVWTEDDQDHPNPEWIVLTVTLELESVPGGTSETDWLPIIGIIVLVVVVIVVAAMLMKKRKGKAEGGPGESAGGMEGMAPPE